MIVGLRPSTVIGTMISDGVMASAHGLFECSSTALALPVLLSLLLSRMLLGSPRTARVLARPDELLPDVDSLGGGEKAVVDVSIVSPRFGDLPRDARSSSTQPAGVGGTGPRVDIDIFWGRRVGGEVMGSGARLMLCDLEEACGGGPGGGGGRGIPGSHLVVEDPRDRDVEGVLIAPVDAALLEAGGLAVITGSSGIARSTAVCAISIEIGGGLFRIAVDCSALCISGDSLDESEAVGFRVNAERLNSGCGLSRDPALARLMGGGGKTCAADDDILGEDRCSPAGEVR